MHSDSLLISNYYYYYNHLSRPNMASSWYQSFVENGYAVVPRVISPEKAAEYQQAALDWLKSFNNPQLDYSDSSTWTASNLPHMHPANLFMHYGVAHEKFIWDIRQEQRIIDVFSELWNTDDLLVSFDALNITLPNRPGHEPRKPWPHVDQSPFRRGLHCVQGIANLSKSGPEDGGLTVYPGSHKAVESFFDEQTDRSKWERNDFFKFAEGQVSWFRDQGFKPHKVTAEAGDLIIWDSRLIHYGAEPTKASDTIRTVAYVAYAPAKLASPETLEKKKEGLGNWLATTHRPHEDILLRPIHPTLLDGAIDERRSEPLNKPELTDRLLKLAGVKQY